jgi:hypothetical protein
MTCGSEFDTTLSVLNKCNGTDLACNDDYCSRQSVVFWDVQEGETHPLRVAGAQGQKGNFWLTINCSQTYPDKCDGCISISDGNFQGDTSKNQPDGRDSSCGTADDIAVWYCYTATCTGLAKADTCGSQFDTTLSVVDECGGIELNCSDKSSCGLQSEITWVVQKGEVFDLRLAGTKRERGLYSLTVSCQGSTSMTDLIFPDTTTTTTYSIDEEEDVDLRREENPSIPLRKREKGRANKDFE